MPAIVRSTVCSGMTPHLEGDTLLRRESCFRSILAISCSTRFQACTPVAAGLRVRVSYWTSLSASLWSSRLSSGSFRTSFPLFLSYPETHADDQVRARQQRNRRTVRPIDYKAHSESQETLERRRLSRRRSGNEGHTCTTRTHVL